MFGQSESQSANGGKLKQECVIALSSVTSPVTSHFEINIVANICEKLLPLFEIKLLLIFVNYCCQYLRQPLWKCFWQCVVVATFLLHGLEML